MKKLILVLALLLLCLTMIPGATAETLTGSLGESSYYQTVINNTVVATTNYPFTSVGVKDIEYAQGTTALVMFDYGDFISVDAGAPAGVGIPCNLTYGSQVVATGTLGYQRSYNALHVEIAGYQYIQFNNDWNLTGLTGNKLLDLNYDHNAIYNISKYVGYGFTGTWPTASYPSDSGDMWIYGHSGSYGGSMTGQYWRTINVNNGADYTATKPSGIGITGNITKTAGTTQAFVFDSAGNVVTSEYTLSATPFNFTTNKEQIKIGILTSTGTFYNTSLLFSPGVTPTPTVTPPANGTFTVQFYVKDNGNSTLLANTYIELHSNDIHDAIYAGYTDVNGLETFAEVPFPTYAPGYNSMEARFFKAGYQYSAWTFIPTGDLFHIQFLIPETGQNPTIASTVNITVHSIDSSNGNANLAGAYVEVYPNVPGPNGVIDWDYKLTGVTNASGLITFQNVPAGAYNEIITTKLGYTTDRYSIGVVPLWDFSHNAYLSTFGVTPTPTPLPQTGAYILSISPATVPNNGNTTATLSSTLDPTLASIQEIWYVYGDSALDTLQPLDFFGQASDFFESGSSVLSLQYIKSGGNWLGWDTSATSFSNNKGASIPNPSNLIFEGIGGTKTVYCAVTLANGTQYYLKGSVVVGAGVAQVKTKFRAVGGYGSDVIYGATINILNKNTGIWKNGTYATGMTDITTPTGTRFDVYGSKSGYANAELLNIIAQDDYIYPLQFNLETTPGVGNQTFYVWVYNEQSLAIPGATVIITKVGGTSVTGSTTGGGQATFTLLNLTSYNYYIAKTGYQSASGSFTTTGATTGEIVVKLVAGAIPTATIPPTATPTVFPTNTGGNYTGFWGPLAEGAKGAGASTGEIPLMLAGLFIFVGFCIGGWSGAAYGPAAFNGQASMAGGVFGFVLSCMFGFIPIVWVISIIIIGVFVFIFFTRS